MSISTYTLYSDAARDTALDAVGGEMMGTQDTELLKQIFVAAGNGGGGGGGVLNPGVAYVQSDGNDSTAEIGKPAKPYLTARAAFTAVKASLNSISAPHSLIFGRGSFSLVLTNEEASAGYKFFFSGVGAARNGTSPATMLTITSIPTDGSGIAGVIDVYSDYSLLINGQFRGGSGSDGSNVTPGGNGGNMNFNSRFVAFGSISVGGGMGGADGGAGAGADGSTVVDIQNINVIDDVFGTLATGPCNVVNGAFY